MRQETLKIATAFKNGKPARGALTETDGKRVWLFGNLIAERMPDGVLMLTLAGWNSATTRDRLNGIADVMGIKVRFFQKSHAAMMRAMVGGEWVETHIDPSERMTFAQA